MKKIILLLSLLTVGVCFPLAGYGQSTSEPLTLVNKAILLGRYVEQMPRLLMKVISEGDLQGAETVLTAWGKSGKDDFVVSVFRLNNDLALRELNNLGLADSEIDQQYQQADEATRLLCRAVEEGPYVRLARVLIAAFGASPYIRQENGDLTLLEVAKAKYGAQAPIVKILENTVYVDIKTAEKTFLRYRD